MSNVLKAPYQWFGSKRQVCSAIWERFGDPDVFIDPFFGSGAILLGRPHEGGLEVINDADSLLCNVWRAITYAPEETAKAATYPPSENDIIARHKWLMKEGRKRTELLKEDPFAYDVQAAGFWLYALSAYVGGNFCDGKSHLNQEAKIPSMSSMGIHRGELDGDVGKMIEYFKKLSWRLRNVKIACGDWSRLTTPAVTIQHGITAAAIDPPYVGTEHSIQYGGDLANAAAIEHVAHKARKWAIEVGQDRRYRVAYCGYEGLEFPKDWEVFEWKAGGGYGNQGEGRGRKNATRERIWFSPYCLKPGLTGLWSQSEEVLPEEPQGQPVEWPVLAMRAQTCVNEPQVEEPAKPAVSAQRGGLFDNAD